MAGSVGKASSLQRIGHCSAAKGAMSTTQLLLAADAGLSTQHRTGPPTSQSIPSVASARSGLSSDRESWLATMPSYRQPACMAGQRQPSQLVTVTTSAHAASVLRVRRAVRLDKQTAKHSASHLTGGGGS